MRILRLRPSIGLKEYLTYANASVKGIWLIRDGFRGGLSLSPTWEEGIPE